MSKLQTLRQALETNPEVTIIDWVEWFNLVGKYNNKDFGRIGMKSGKRLLKGLIPQYPSGLAHIVQYYIAPKNGIHTVPELDEFMGGLIPEGLKPDFVLHPSQGSGYVHYDGKYNNEMKLEECVVRFSDDPTGSNTSYGYPVLLFGRLSFTEKIGEGKIDTKTVRYIKIEDEEILRKAEEMLTQAEFVNGQKTIDTKDAFDLKRGISIRPYPSEAVGRYAIYPGNKSRVGREMIILNDFGGYKPPQELVQKLLHGQNEPKK